MECNLKAVCSVKVLIMFAFKLNVLTLSELFFSHFVHRSRAANISNLKRAVEQLRREASANRMWVSQACASLIDYCDKQRQYDMLLTGEPPNNGENPFKDRRPCRLL